MHTVEPARKYVYSVQLYGLMYINPYKSTLPYTQFTQTWTYANSLDDMRDPAFLPSCTVILFAYFTRPVTPGL